VDDAQLIANLLFTYAERMDAGDFEGVADLLADAELTGEGLAPLQGREAILDLYRTTARLHPDTGTPKTKHVTTNVLIEVDDAAGTATARSYYTVLQAVQGSLALQPVICGRYHDRFARAGGLWRFTGRRMIVDLVGDLSQHMLWDLPAP
jgi:hypothetical protein